MAENVAAREFDALTRKILGAEGPDRESALTEFHDRFRPGLVRHFIGRLGAGDPAAADELAQRTFIAFWDTLRAGRYDPAQASLSTFLFAVANIVWMRWRRETHRAAERDAEFTETTAPDRLIPDDPADAAHLAALLDLTRRTLAGDAGADTLTETDRQALRAVAAGRTDRDLAAEMGVSPSTAHARKAAAVERLARFLTSRGFSDDTPRAHTPPAANNTRDTTSRPPA